MTSRDNVRPLYVIRPHLNRLYKILSQHYSHIGYEQSWDCFKTLKKRQIEISILHPSNTRELEDSWSLIVLMEETQEMSQKLLDLHREGEIEEAKSLVSRSLHCPIHLLPIEVLCRIFRMCNPNNDFKRPTQNSVPLIFGQVCRYWRDIAWNEPTLWTRPRVSFPTLQKVWTRGLIDFYRTRSKDAAFDLAINQTIRFKPAFWDDKDDMKGLSYTLPHCRELCLVFNDVNWISYFSQLNPAVYKRVESISLKIHAPVHFLYHLENLPQLRTVQLHLDIPETLKFFSLPYTQLLNVSVVLGRENSSAVSPAINTWRSLISKCSNIRVIVAYFQGRGCSDHLSLNPSSINSSLARFDHVRKVIIRVGFRADLASILSGFSFPMIEELHVIATSNPVSLLSADVPFIEGLPLRLSYFFRLTSLRLIRISITQSQLQALLQATPLITSLDFMIGVFIQERFQIEDDVLLFLLTIHDTENELLPLLPLLRQLRLYLKEDNEARYAILACSRYRWMSKYAKTTEESRQLSCTVPSYPFRLYLKYEPGGTYIIPSIARMIGPTAFPILWPERSNSFTKELWT